MVTGWFGAFALYPAALVAMMPSLITPPYAIPQTPYTACLYWSTPDAPISGDVRWPHLRRRHEISYGRAFAEVKDRCSALRNDAERASADALVVANATGSPVDVIIG